jgi:hypothetical protein
MRRWPKTLKSTVSYSQGRLPGLCPLRSDGSHGSQAGRLNRITFSHGMLKKGYVNKDADDDDDDDEARTNEPS